MVLRAIRQKKQDNERQVREVLSEEGTFELNTKLSRDSQAKTWKEDLFRCGEKSLGRVGWGWVGGAWHYLSSREKPMWLEQSEGKDAKREEQEGRGQMLQDLTGQNKMSVWVLFYMCICVQCQQALMEHVCCAEPYVKSPDAAVKHCVSP